MPVINFRECPASICNYYDKGPSNQRVLRVNTVLLPSGYQDYIITHTYGKDRWRHVDGEWTLIRNGGSTTER